MWLGGGGAKNQPKSLTPFMDNPWSKLIVMSEMDSTHPYWHLNYNCFTVGVVNELPCLSGCTMLWAVRDSSVLWHKHWGNISIMTWGRGMFEYGTSHNDLRWERSRYVANQCGMVAIFSICLEWSSTCGLVLSVKLSILNHNCGQSYLFVTTFNNKNKKWILIQVMVWNAFPLLTLWLEFKRWRAKADYCLCVLFLNLQQGIILFFLKTCLPQLIVIYVDEFFKLKSSIALLFVPFLC